MYLAFGSINIRQYLLRLRRIIVNYDYVYNRYVASGYQA